MIEQPSQTMLNKLRHACGMPEAPKAVAEVSIYEYEGIWQLTIQFDDPKLRTIDRQFRTRRGAMLAYDKWLTDRGLVSTFYGHVYPGH